MVSALNDRDINDRRARTAVLSFIFQTFIMLKFGQKTLRNRIDGSFLRTDEG